MNENRENYSTCPDNIAVIGGGRWSRVFIGVLCDLVHPSVGISAHSQHCAESMMNWASDIGIEDRVRFSSEFPHFLDSESNAIIVVNAARDHEKAVEWALSANIPVLVEKPIALSSGASQRLSEIAQLRNVRFAAAHVFLFAGYITHFSKLVAEEGKIEFLRILWSDPQFESRYGESKQFDQSLPIFADWLPHVMSILSAIVPNLPEKCEKMKFQKGGAHLELEFMCGDIPCIVELIRNSDKRQRTIEAFTGKKKIQLDFAKEPGIITSGSATMSGDMHWDVKKRPVAQMLTSFLQWAAIGKEDGRLNISLGLQACKIIDQIYDIYCSARNSWLISKLDFPVNLDDDLHYSLCEIFLYNGRLSKINLEQKIEQVRRKFNGVDGSRWINELAASRDPALFLQAIAK